MVNDIVEPTRSLQEYLAARRARVEAALDAYLPPADTRPPRLHEAMRYSVFAGGKRLRPILVLMAAELCGRAPDDVLFAAAAIELIHTYSLVHDDLPAMDDDDLRRGQPTTHAQYGEALAILAGDALLTLAFQIMSDPRHAAACSSDAIMRAARELSLAAGSTGMVGGQVLDLEAEDRQVTADELDRIHALKTGKLLTVGLRMGAILADAEPDTLTALSDYGQRIGLAFQIVDDMLDLESTEAELGKPVKSDLANRKSTYPSLHGLAESKRLAASLIRDARTAVQSFGERAWYLHELAEYILARTH